MPVENNLITHAISKPSSTTSAEAKNVETPKTRPIPNDSVEISSKDNNKKGKKFYSTPLFVLGVMIFSGVVGAAIQKRKSFPSITKMTSEYEEVLGRKLTDKETAKLHKKCQTTKDANWNFVDEVIDALMFL